VRGGGHAGRRPPLARARRGLPRRPAAASARARTEQDHTEIVEAAKAALTDAPGRRVTLADLARRVYASPFHLARVFRERTGFSVHGYQTQLRLRLALDALHDGCEIGDLALELGFSSHSHFTSAFRASFGRPPSAVRGLGRRGLRELRTFVEAPLANPS
jgi:AraC-like DNA-binding protein